MKLLQTICNLSSIRVFLVVTYLALSLTTPAQEKLTFDSDRNGNEEIYVMKTDGTNQTNLTNNSVIDFASAFSPDGRKIAFFSIRDGNREIYIMNSNGSNQIRLTIC